MLSLLLLCLAAWLFCSSPTAVHAQVPPWQQAIQQVFTNNRLCGLSEEETEAALGQITEQVNEINRNLVLKPECGEGLWYRIADEDFTGVEECLFDFQLVTQPIRGCELIPESVSCQGFIYSINEEYTSMCGRASIRSLGSPTAFNNQRPGLIDGGRFGRIIPGGGQILWGYAVDSSEESGETNCPCNSNVNIRSAFRNNYFCDSTVPVDSEAAPRPLFNGNNCGNVNAECCNFNHPPYFTRTFPLSAGDPFFQLCADEVSDRLVVESLEIYIQ